MMSGGDWKDPNDPAEVGEPGGHPPPSELPDNDPASVPDGTLPGAPPDGPSPDIPTPSRRAQAGGS